MSYTYTAVLRFYWSYRISEELIFREGWLIKWKLGFLYIYLQAVNWLSKQILKNLKSKDLIWIYFEECFDASVIEEDENSVEINGKRENKDYLGAEYQGITLNKGSLLFHLKNSISHIQIKVIFDFIHSFLFELLEFQL